MSISSHPTLIGLICQSHPFAGLACFGLFLNGWTAWERWFGLASARNYTQSELSRIEALETYEILDTPREQEFDDVALLASEICQTPIAVVNLIAADRQFFKAEKGLGVRTTPFESSFCVKAILEEDFLQVEDATADPRFACNPLVTEAPHLRFYAGALLKTSDGVPIGTLCVLDYKQRRLTDLQQRTLRVLARQVMAQLELRKSLRLEAETRRRAEEEKARYQAIIESAIDYAIIVADTEGTITDWNSGASRILGWSADEALGQHISLFFTEDDRQFNVADDEMQSSTVKGRAGDERWHVRKSGETFWASGEMMPLQFLGGDTSGFLKILRDRTVERRISENLRELDERLKLSLSASGGVGLWDWMLDTDLLHGDENFARMYGLGVEEVAAGVTMERYQVYVVPDDIPGLRASLKATFEQGAPFEVEYRLSVPGRGQRWVECKGKVIPAEAGQRPRFSGTAVDITKLKEAEQQKDLLMQELNHRVKNTFSVVQAIASQTLRNATDARAAAGKIERRLLALARAHDILLQGSWKSAELNSLVLAVSRLLGGDARGQFRLRGPQVTLGPSTALSFALILHEMGTNAMKYGALSSETGHVDVSWGIEDASSRFSFSWQEHGGPIVVPPTQIGFGTKLIEKSLASTDGAFVSLSYPPTGAILLISAPLETLRED